MPRDPQFVARRSQTVRVRPTLKPRCAFRLMRSA